MTAQEKVTALLKQLATDIRASGQLVSHIAHKLDMSHQTINRLLGETDKPNKYGCSTINLVKIARFFDYEVQLVKRTPHHPPADSLTAGVHDKPDN